MSYTVPSLSVPVVLEGSYSPPALSVPVVLGAPATDDRSLTISGETLAPTGLILAGVLIQATLSGETLAPTGLLTGAYDPNLLSAVHAVTAEGWQPGAAERPGPRATWQSASRLLQEGRDHWQPALSRPASTETDWQPAAALNGTGQTHWQAAETHSQTTSPAWESAARLDTAGADGWQTAAPQTRQVGADWRDLPRLDRPAINRWQFGDAVSLAVQDRANDGLSLLAVEIEVWQRAGYPANARNPDKDAIPGPVSTPWGTALKIVCPLPGTALRLGRVPCILIAEREVAVQRSYMSLNSAALVRWPDLTPLPITSMTIETDFDSWCWALSATLAGPDAWPLVQPNPLACEVLATINGQAWKFLLDVPSTNRSFNRDQVTLKGRSRSAWLQEPYTPATNRDEASSREMQQLGEAALDNTGWTLAWLGENWVVPAGRYHSFTTPIGALIRLAQTTHDGLYTDPNLQIITLQKRWPVASWLIDGEVADLAIPESAILSLSQSPLYTLPLNGVYVSGTSHGALARVKIAGTDGALQPAEPIIDELLCDEAGVAARQRGLNALSDAGAGFTMDAETLFIPPTFPLVPPGLIVSIAGMKGVSRSCQIIANWSQGLQVKQSIGLERREVES